MGIEAIQPSEKRVLRLEGSWTIERARELKDLLIEALRSNDRFIVDLAGLLEADVSCLQLLCAAHRASLKSGEQLLFNDKRSEAFLRVARDAGFVRTAGCQQIPHKGCLWMGGSSS